MSMEENGDSNLSSDLEELEAEMTCLVKDLERLIGLINRR